MSNTANDLENRAGFLALPYPRSGVGSSPNKTQRINADSTFNPTLLQARAELRNTMHGKIGITPLESLMSDFLPAPNPNMKTIPNIFTNVPDFASESEMYTWIVDLLNRSELFNNHTFVATPYKADVADPSRQAIDCGMYHNKLPPLEDQGSENEEMTHNRRVNWSRLELGIECKLHRTNQDPFDDRQADGEPVAADRKKALGQILSYAELVFKHQQRTFQFMVLFLGHYARVVHIDRSGAYSSYKFEYKTQGAALTRFLVRYSRLFPAARGFDPTAHRIEPDSELGRKMEKWGSEAAEADPEDHVQQLFNQSLDKSWAWWKLEVHVEKKASTLSSKSGRAKVEIQNFVVGKPHFQAGGVACRGTRGYVAVRINAEDNLEGPFVYLKDAWRVDHPGIEREGSVLQTLNAKETPFVPTLVCHGDLKGATQVTRSQAVWEKANKGKKGSMKKHQHYRLVVAEVGKPLDQFDRGWTLVMAVLCCIIAHAHAYKKANIIHRDISAGNILLHKAADGSWVGLLNDWELSKVVGVSEVRQPDRTGTWQFMSAHALNDPSKEIDIPDELESFFNVLLYYAIRFLPHNINPANVGQFLVDYFDGYSNFPEGYRCGSRKLEALSSGVIRLRQYNGDKTAVLTFMEPADEASKSDETPEAHPIDTIFQTLLSWLHAHYSLDELARAKRVIKPLAESDPIRKRALALKAMASKLEDSEPIDDKNALNLAADGPSAGPSTTSVRTLAEKVQSHSSVINFITGQIGDLLWPENDKGPDLKPATKLAPRIESAPTAPIFQGSMASSSTKRRLENPDVPSSKRSRVDGAA